MLRGDFTMEIKSFLSIRRGEKRLKGGPLSPRRNAEGRGAGGGARVQRWKERYSSRE